MVLAEVTVHALAMEMETVAVERRNRPFLVAEAQVQDLSYFRYHQ